LSTVFQDQASTAASYQRDIVSRGRYIHISPVYRSLNPVNGEQVPCLFFLSISQHQHFELSLRFAPWNFLWVFPVGLLLMLLPFLPAIHRFTITCSSLNASLIPHPLTALPLFPL